MLKNCLTAVVLAGLLGGVYHAEACAADKNWRRIASLDVEAAYAQLRSNHPEMKNPADPTFPALLDRARSNGLSAAKHARSAAGLAAALDAFTATLRDGHAFAYANLPKAAAPVVRWPGFVTVWRGKNLIVYKSEDPSIPNGSIVVGCDGVLTRDLVLKKVFSQWGRPDVDGQWWTEAPKLFVDKTGDLSAPLGRCDFQKADKTQSVSLTWRDETPIFQTWKDESYNGSTLPLGVTKPTPEVTWVSLPTFDPDEAEVAQYKTLLKTLTQSRSSLLLHKKAIVIDLRNNQGGSSDWSFQVAESLWGTLNVDRALADYFRNVSVLWRATQGNTAHIEKQLKMFEQQGQGSSAIANEFRGVVQGMRAALKAGQDFYRQPGYEPLPAAATGQPVVTLETPVYVIVPGQCASACLDAVDMFTRFSNTKLMGAPSSADSDYIDIRFVALPSGLGDVVIPNKVWVGRPRKAQAFYRPQIEIDDVDWSVPVFLRAVLADLSTAQIRPAAATPSAHPPR